jgi:protein-tyrosine phosphatase
MNILLVCLGNICRSPMAEGALRAQLAVSALAGKVQVDSAGTTDWHQGRGPDTRAIACAQRHGVDISGLRARALTEADFSRFDWIFCADDKNLCDVLAIAPASAHGRIALWLPWAGVGDAIPDPYAGDDAAFEQVWQMVEDAARSTVMRLARTANFGIIDI